MTKSRLVLIIIILAAIGLFWSFEVFKGEKTYLKVNEENKDIISNALNGIVKHPNAISKLAIGNGWHSGELTVYYWYGGREEMMIGEGFRTNNGIHIDGYIRKHGYDYGFWPLIVGIPSFVIIIVFLKYLFFDCRKQDESLTTTE